MPSFGPQNPGSGPTDHTPPLRLVNTGGFKPTPRTRSTPRRPTTLGPNTWVGTRHPQPSKATAPNPSKPRVNTLDPRWVLAAQVAAALDGGRAAILTPERRERVLKIAKTLRITPFQSALIIAAVQDRVRSGLPALDPALARTLAVIPKPMPSPNRRLQTLIAAGSSVLMATAITALLITWLLSA